MIFKLNVNTKLSIDCLEDLPRLKEFLEVNELEKTNFSRIRRLIEELQKNIMKALK